MKNQIADFKKTTDFLVCVDSDGCAMDTMDVKHEKCFGPKAIEVWNLQYTEKRFMELWNSINLYTRTRGINRFKGLVKTFEDVAAEGIDMPNLSSVKEWIETTKELSNPSLEKAIEETGDEQLKKALQWSIEVNQAIQALADDDEPFPGVKKGLETIEKVADVAIVSSANGGAVQAEWTRHDLAAHVQVLLGQEAGSKAYCIEQLKNMGYSANHVLMVGDAPGDLQAAEQNGVCYYPILVGKEAFSWERLSCESLNKFMNGTFKGDYQQQLIDEFYGNLK